MDTELNEPPGWKSERYRLEGEVRPAALGTWFWSAWDEETERRVMVKGMRRSQTQEGILDCFEEEGRVVATLSHPNILRLLDRVDAGDWHFHVYELEGAETFDDKLSRGRLSVAETLPIVQQVVDAMVYLHTRGLVHGYAHPANILVRPDGHVKVTGFAYGWEQLHTLVRPWSAPEHALDNKRTPRGDVYLVGGLLWRAIVGETYVSAKTDQELIAFHCSPPAAEIGERAPDAPRWLRRLVRRCLSADPDERPSSADEIWVELEGRSPSRGLAPVREALESLADRPWADPIPALLGELRFLESPSLALLRLIDLCELLLKLAAAAAQGPSPGVSLPDKPSLGHWMQALRKWAPALGEAMPKSTLRFFERMVAVRNEHRGHGALGRPDSHERALREHVGSCARAIANTPLYADLSWDGERLLRGSRPVLSGDLVNRSPCSVCERTEVFAYNGARRGVSSFLSYETNHVIRRS